MTGKSGDPKAEAEKKLHKAIDGLTPDQISQLLDLNPALANELANSSDGGAAEALKKLNLQEIMTGLAASGKNAKDMGAYKFWQTQPVPKFGDEEDKKWEDGPIKVQKVEDVPKQPAPLGDGFEWVELDLTDPEEMKELHDLLYGHYVEDDEAMFRFSYSASLLKWYVAILHIIRI